MSLTAAQTTQIFEILGVPQDGTGEVVAGLTGLFGPAFESYDLSAVVAKITAKITGLSAAQEARVTALLTRWDAITSTSPLAVADAGGSRGTLTDYPAERENIRAVLGNILGLALPSGGFSAETRRGRHAGGTVSR